MNVGRSIKIILAQRGMQQKELAELLGTSANQVSVFCRSKTVKGQTLQNLADAFEMSVSEFVKVGEE